MGWSDKELRARRSGDTKKRSQDVRSEYDRDEARLIHSAAFRRLQSKTQVLGLGESDFYRTRLTHSMEVAQIGRGIVQSLSKINPKQKKYLPDTSLISAICLAHDIGHPPFGHGGEVALNYCMREHGGFEGNGQTLRILGKLDKYKRGYGMDPTRRMLLGVLKYPNKYSSVVNKSFYQDKDCRLPNWLFNSKYQKPPKCYHDCDQDIIDFIFKPFSSEDIKKFTEKDDIEEKHSKNKYKSLDASIMNLADNISYSLHDLEDALSLKMITKNDWKHHFRHNKKSFEKVGISYKEITEDLFSDSYRRKNAIGSLVNLMISNSKIEDNGSGCSHPILRYGVFLERKTEHLRQEIFSLVNEKVIKHENVQQLEFKGQKLVVELFEVLSSDPERFLPKVTLEKLKESENRHMKQRVICDFISGMTDDYATRFYEKIFTPQKGSIFDRL